MLIRLWSFKATKRLQGNIVRNFIRNFSTGLTRQYLSIYISQLGPQVRFYFLAVTNILKLGMLATVPEPGRG